MTLTIFSPFTLSLIPSPSVSDALLAEAAALFSFEYGIWGPQAAEKMGGFCRAGQRVKMSATRLRQQSLIATPGARSVMVCCKNGDELVGHAFATRWIHEGRAVCWVTQLCVRSEFRQRGISTKILQLLKKENESDQATIYGILSSHPAALMALLRTIGDGIEAVDMGIVQCHAASIMSASPVAYVRNAKPKGALLEDAVDGSMCCVDTQFWVDHAEPLAVLKKIEERIEWPFGELFEGCEWLALAEVKAV